MTDRFFVDTNLLVYSRDASEHEKQQKAMKWMTRLWHDKSGRVSYQVLQEFYITVTHKLEPGLPIHIARMDVRSLMSWQPVSSSDSVTGACLGNSGQIRSVMVGRLDRLRGTDCRMQIPVDRGSPGEPAPGGSQSCEPLSGRSGHVDIMTQEHLLLNLWIGNRRHPSGCAV
jgi:hypothetical protein